MPYDDRDDLEPRVSRPTRRELSAARRRRELVSAAVFGGLALLVAASATVWLLSAREPASPSPKPAARRTPAPRLLSGEQTAAALAEPATVAPVATTPATGTAPSGEIVIGWVGDTTPGSRYGNPPEQGRALFSRTREMLSAPDIMVANLEGTYGTGGKSKCDGKDSSACYAFQASPASAAALPWAGIDLVNLANNHSHDYLARGLTQTKRALDDNGVAYTGLTDQVASMKVEDVTIAFLGFSPYSWSPSIADLGTAQDLVRRADARADIVVVLMHAGAEGADKTHTPKGPETAFGEFRGDARAFSHAVIDAGADLVLGSGPHVVRGMEEYQGRLVAYSLGNFAGWGNFSRSGTLGLSGLLSVRLAPDGRVLGGRWHALRLASPGVPEPDPRAASLKLVRKLSRSDFDRPVVPDDDGVFVFEAP